MMKMKIYMTTGTESKEGKSNGVVTCKRTLILKM
jgi:hypothetical protein